MASANIHKVFGAMAAEYNQFRPKYPPELLARIMGRVTKKTLYVDLACGTGQLTKQLAPNFTSAIGVDKASGSVKVAASHDNNITWMEGDAYHIPAANNSVSLLTVAQALHWFLDEPPKLWAEFDRVLESQGVLAVTSYAAIEPTNPVLKAKFDQFYLGTLGSHLGPADPRCAWQCDRRWVDSGYEGVTFPYPSSAAKEAFRVPVSLSRDHFFGYIRTYSALSSFKGEEDPVRALEEDFGAVDVVDAHITYWLLTFIKP